MKNIEDTRESPIELGEVEEIERSSVPTYHWSQIRNPRYKSTIEFLNKGAVTVTQKVHLARVDTKSTPLQSACVVYDTEFIEYQLLEIIAPFICDIKNGNLELDGLQTCLVSTLWRAMNQAEKRHDNAIQLCNSMGVSLSYDPKFVLRSFKLGAAENYKDVQLLDSLDA